MKPKLDSGFGLVHLIIGTGIMAAVLMVVAQYTVNVKDQQKVQREKLSFLEIVRQINDVLDRPVSCACNFKSVIPESQNVEIQEIKIFGNEDCSDELKIVASQSVKFDGITLSMKMDNFRVTGDSEFLADFHISGERGTNAAKKNFTFDRTLRFTNVKDSSGNGRQICEI